MKTILVLMSLLISFEAFANAKIVPLMEVSFEKNRKTHLYVITKNSVKKPVFTLTFTNEKRQVKNRRISESQAELIKNEATRIIWENQYRSPASKDSCREYMSLKANSEKTRICYENKVATGRAFGFINSLSQTVQ